MHNVHTAMARASSKVRRVRSARYPKGMLPSTPTIVIAAATPPRAASLAPNSSRMPSSACDSDSRSPCSSMTVPASATTGMAP